MKRDYTKIDARIVEAIECGKLEFFQIHQSCDVLANESFRVIDRRLQALRKEGKITFSHKMGWSVNA